MRRKFSFKRGILKFVAFASALALVVGQGGGYASTAFADNTVTGIDKEVSGSIGDDLTYTLSTSGTLTINGKGDVNEAPWSDYKDYITSVVVGEGVTIIGDSIFKNYTNLTSVTLPSTLYMIEDYAFAECKKLTSVNLPEGLDEICEGAFQNTGLTSLKLPSSLFYIGRWAFSGCSSITGSVALPEKADIYTEAFKDCSGMTGTFVFPGSMEVTWVEVPDGSGESRPAWYIYPDIISGCTGLSEVVNLTWHEIELPDLGGDTWVLSDDTTKTVTSLEGSTSSNTAIRSCKVTIYDSGKLVSEQTVLAGEKIEKPADPTTKAGVTFTGWRNADGVFDFSQPVTAGMTLNASYSAATGNVVATTTPSEEGTTATGNVATTAPSEEGTAASGPSSMKPVTGTIDSDISNDDDDDTATTTESTTAASTPTSVKVNGTNSTSVVNTVKNVAEGSTVTVDMSSNNTIAKNVLEAAKTKKVELVLNMGSYKWTIDSSNISTDLHDVNMSVSFGTDNIPQNTLKAVAGNNSYQTISLAYSGPFGFTASLGFNVGSASAGKYANLYYYNADNQLEYQNSGKIDQQGNVAVAFSHASEYVVVISDSLPAAASTVTNTSATSPVTADFANIVPFIVLMLIAAAMMLGSMAYKKKHI